MSDLAGILVNGGGGELRLLPGRRLRARVVAVDGGRAVLAVAGVEVTAATDAPLAVGATVTLVVDAISEGRIALRLL